MPQHLYPTPALSADLPMKTALWAALLLGLVAAAAAAGANPKPAIFGGEDAPKGR